MPISQVIQHLKLLQQQIDTLHGTKITISGDGGAEWEVLSPSYPHSRADRIQTIITQSIEKTMKRP